MSFGFTQRGDSDFSGVGSKGGSGEEGSGLVGRGWNEGLGGGRDEGKESGEGEE